MHLRSLFRIKYKLLFYRKSSDSRHCYSIIALLLSSFNDNAENSKIENRKVRKNCADNKLYKCLSSSHTNLHLHHHARKQPAILLSLERSRRYIFKFAYDVYVVRTDAEKHFNLTLS
ncbi:hypothetical protein XENTR_v10000894 [Xenopus tropicalis]|nr:hypothetical protein XENTR_v10000894 [Xenopus tropicalis]